MAGKLDLSVILPSYMEEENLRQLLPRLVAVLRGLGPEFEVLVVDTRKPLDNSRAVCEQNDVLYINRQGGDSFGDAVRTSLEQARGEFLLFMDADGSHPPEFIANLWAEASGNDVVIASRYIEGGATDNNRMLVAMSLLVNLIYSLVLDLGCKDVSNSFKLYRAPLLRGLSLVSNNFDIIEEILFKLRRTNPSLRIKEIPFTFRKRMFGNTKRNLFVFACSFLFTLFRLRFLR